jgi:hypothetical protein
MLRRGCLHAAGHPNGSKPVGTETNLLGNPADVAGEDAMLIDSVIGELASVTDGTDSRIPHLCSLAARMRRKG